MSTEPPMSHDPPTLTAEEKGALQWELFRANPKAHLDLDDIDDATYRRIKRARAKMQKLEANRLCAHRSIGFLTDQIARHCGEEEYLRREAEVREALAALNEARRERRGGKATESFIRGIDALKAWVDAAESCGVPTRWTDARSEIVGEWCTGFQPRVTPEVHVFPKTGHDMIDPLRLRGTGWGWRRAV
jgi:hypothetical protein